MSPNDIFENLYDWFFNQTFSVELHTRSAYTLLFFAALIPALVLMAIFYFLIKYPFCKWYHWIMILIGAMIFTDILTYNLLSNNLAVYMVDSANYPDINGYVMNMIVANSLYSIIIGFICTLFFKRAPLPQHNIPWSK